MPIRGTKIDVAGPLNAATAEGILADAKQIWLESTDENLDKSFGDLSSDVGIKEYKVFSDTESFKLHEVVLYNDNRLYRFIKPHNPGPWNQSEVEPWNIVRDFGENHSRVLDGGTANSKYGGARTIDCGKATN